MTWLLLVILGLSTLGISLNLLRDLVNVLLKMFGSLNLNGVPSWFKLGYSPMTIREEVWINCVKVRDVETVEWIPNT